MAAWGPVTSPPINQNHFKPLTFRFQNSRLSCGKINRSVWVNPFLVVTKFKVENPPKRHRNVDSQKRISLWPKPSKPYDPSFKTPIFWAQNLRVGTVGLVLCVPPCVGQRNEHQEGRRDTPFRASTWRLGARSRHPQSTKIISNH